MAASEVSVFIETDELASAAALAELRETAVGQRPVHF